MNAIKMSIVVLAASCLNPANSATVAGGWNDWMTKEQKTQITSIAIGYEAATECKRDINIQVVANAISAGFGGRAFSSMDTAQIALFVSLATTQESSRHFVACDEIDDDFGPNGSLVKGLID
jgi:hypothetical protein